MAGLKWKIGEVEVFQLIELEAGALIQSVIEKATPENVRSIGWLRPHFADEEGRLKAIVQGFLVKSDDKIILIDTCNGNDKMRTTMPQWDRLQTDFMGRLAELGVAPSEVAVVACTHLHMDHIGWNTRLDNGAWVPTFPNARYLFARREYEYLSQKPAEEIRHGKGAFYDSVNPIVEAGLATLVGAHHAIDRHVRFTPTPGHTPAHASVVIESRNERAMISGDFLHHPCQIAHPDWTTVADSHPDVAVLTRQRVFAEIADTETLLLGSHFAGPVSGRVVRSRGGFVFEVGTS